MMKRRINIEIASDDISMAEAVSAVAVVIAGGRISGYGECFCYATTFAENMVVEAKVNKLDGRSSYATSDSFRVYRDERASD